MDHSEKHKSHVYQTESSDFITAIEQDIIRNIIDKNHEKLKSIYSEYGSESVYCLNQTRLISQTDGFPDQLEWKYDGRENFKKTASSVFQYDTNCDASFLDTMQLVIAEYDKIRNKTIRMIKKKKMIAQLKNEMILKAKLLGVIHDKPKHLKDTPSNTQHIQTGVNEIKSAVKEVQKNKESNEFHLKRRCESKIKMFCCSKSTVTVFKCQSKVRRYRKDTLVDFLFTLDNMNRKIDWINEIAGMESWENEKLARMFVNVIKKLKSEKSFRNIYKKSHVVAHLLRRTITTVWRLLTNKWSYHRDSSLYEALFFLKKIASEFDDSNFTMVLKNRIVQQIKEQRNYKKLLKSKDTETVLNYTRKILEIRHKYDRKLKKLMKDFIQ